MTHSFNTFSRHIILKIQLVTEEAVSVIYIILMEVCLFLIQSRHFGGRCVFIDGYCYGVAALVGLTCRSSLSKCESGHSNNTLAKYSFTSCYSCLSPLPSPPQPPLTALIRQTDIRQSSKQITPAFQG